MHDSTVPFPPIVSYPLTGTKNTLEVMPRFCTRVTGGWLHDEKNYIFYIFIYTSVCIHVCIYMYIEVCVCIYSPEEEGVARPCQRSRIRDGWSLFKVFF